MGDRSRNTAGQYEGAVDDDDVVAAVRAHDPAATSEVADALGLSRQAVDRRLRRLRDDGRVVSKKIGASLVWYPPRETGEAAASAAAPTGGGDGATTAPANTRGGEGRETHRAPAPVRALAERSNGE